MTGYANYRNVSMTATLLICLVCALLTLGCTSNAKSRGTGEKSVRSEASHITINCIGDRLDNPPEPFHYSFKFTDGQKNENKEADVTPQTMDITITNNLGSHKYHGVRSDEGSWSSALIDLSGSGLTVMTSRVDFIKDNSAIKRVGEESVNGYQTTKYSIDTTAANSSDRQTFETMFGSGSYEKGMMWATAEGCPVKLVLDEARKENNGNVDKFHYDIAMIKK